MTSRAEGRAAEAWIYAGRGLRYREHGTRRHGPRPDRYWCLRYKLDGRDITEAVGWWSKGVSKAKCLEILAELRRNQRTGRGPRTLRELRESEKARQAARTAEETALKPKPTVAEFWVNEYRPRLKATARPLTVTTGDKLIKSALSGLADRPLNTLSPTDLENLVVRPLVENSRSPAYIETSLDFVSAMWNLARTRGLVSGPNPKTKVRRPRVDNRRDRFLTASEALKLLAALKKRSTAAHDLALLSLFSGLRIGEGLALTWADIDLEDGVIFVKDPKNKNNRHAYVTAELRAMLTRRGQGRPRTARVFAEGSAGYWAVSGHFRSAVKELGFNRGLTDPRRKVVFHTLRHTFASWLVKKGQPLFTVSRLLGHRNIKHTERYAHLEPETQREATAGLEGILADFFAKE